jgi:hypothetical protein
MRLAALLVSSALPVAAAFAQGLTGASVAGTVVNADGAPVPGASVTLLNSSTGIRLSLTARSQGEFLFDNVPVGGPYRLEARSIGLLPASIGGITLHLGDRFTRQLVLGGQRAKQLEDVLVKTSTLRDPGAGGPAYNISGDAIRKLPLLNRDFTGLFAMAPQATATTASGLSISGQHVRFNAIQVDGSSGNDFFGLQVTPGAGTGAKIISLEALEEIRVLVAPFDVRQGGFSGGLINAVTRSGTNQFHSSVFSSFARAGLVGRDTANAPVGDFDVAQYGITGGGPLIRDRLHFFVVADLQSSRKTFVGPAADDPTTGITSSAARRAQQIFRDVYGFDAGGPEIPSLSAPNSNVYAKLSWQASQNHLIDFSQTWVDARNDVLQRNTTDRDQWQLSNSGTRTLSNVLITRARAGSSMGSFTNELIASITTAKFRIRSTNHTPVFLVRGDVLAGAFIAGGSARGAQDVDTDQRALELSDNLSWARGAHQITLGTQNQLLHFHDNFFLNHWGAWSFASLDSLERRLPFRYEIALPIKSGPLADYPATLLAGYIQDRWTATSRLTLTAGLRVDVPFLRAPKRNAALASIAALGGIDTGEFPNGNAVLSPRLGFALALGTNHDSMLRGGIGAFAGKPLFAWVNGAYVNTGQEQTNLVCMSPQQGVPTPTTDIDHLPSSCIGNQPTAPLPNINYVSPDFRFQQAIKYVLGFDHSFGGGLTASLDAIHTRTRNTLYISDVNLVEHGLNAEGRMMYGESSTSRISVSRLDSTTVAQVWRFENRSADRSTAMTAAIQKRWTSGAELSLGYNWSRSDDVMSLSGLNTSALSQSNPIDGTLANRVLRRSARDIPHNFVATAIVPVPYGLTTSLFLRARSGTPYAYTIGTGTGPDGDANADGINGNDLAYIPNDSTDITLSNPKAFSTLNAFIESEPCLAKQRGRIMTRNSCRNPSVTVLDGRIAKSFALGSRGFELSADLFNLPNMLNRHWGLVRESSNTESKRGLLAVSGWDPIDHRPRYTVPTISGQPVMPSLNTVVVDASRWRVQLGGRISF